MVRSPSCYAPDGADMTTVAGLIYSSCNATAANSHCCAASDTCIDNGFCFGTGNNWGMRLYRGGCTDVSWGSSACPQRCQDVGTNGPAGITLAENLAVGLFCCTNGDNKLLNGSTCFYPTRGSSQPFALSGGKIIHDRSNGAIVNDETQTTTTSSGPVTQTVLQTVTQSASQSSCPLPATSHSHEVAVGVGVGIPLIIVALTTILLFLWERKKRRLAETMPAPSMSQVHRHAIGNMMYPGYAHHQNPETELPSDQARSELASTNTAVELDSRK
ncbi:hypothetical protein K461DRAFT_314825 [Myriangium duriaei CBS 260.36]|uniref:Mid2 domain-containing protein n=1 Tax=Myriangium duriaei CBS 260.36 TaxID=1168546 RepID=A0A9P4ITG6_9PEZI|nr:hypothetical protein K461DRAFT_314825 [Myriangium duriaei CBS 260.36]